MVHAAAKMLEEDKRNAALRAETAISVVNAVRFDILGRRIHMGHWNLSFWRRPKRTAATPLRLSDRPRKRLPPLHGLLYSSFNTNSKGKRLPIQDPPPQP